MPDAFAPIRDHLRAARARKGWTQEELAEEAAVELQLVADLETRRRAVLLPGDARSPDDWANFRKICQALGENAETILRAQGWL